MNKQIRKQAMNKLKSETGASILIALLVFLIAAMTGSVILTSATVSSGAMNRTEKAEQDIDVLKSAANVLTDDLEDQVYLKGQNAKNLGNSLESISDLQQYLGQKIMNGGSADFTIDTIQIDDGADEDVKNTVKDRAVTAKVSMDSDYRISVILYIKDHDKDGSHLYVNFNGEPVDIDTDDELAISQKDPKISTSTEKGDNNATSEP